MIFPRLCKEIGYASTRPCGDQVYFLSRYLIHETRDGPEVLEVVLDDDKAGLLRPVREVRVLALPEEVVWYPKKVQLHNRANLIRIALDSGRRCTLFTGLDEHLTFVLDPDLSSFQSIFVYDVTPPRPSLSATIRDLEEAGMFSELDIQFVHTLRDISQIDADVYPCRVSGFTKTLDADLMIGGEKIAGCRTGKELLRECYGNGFLVTDICPLTMVSQEPFVTRCCRREQEGITEYHGRLGTVVHWGASPFEIFSAIGELVSMWRKGR
jgi:hypothetical protein